MDIDLLKENQDLKKELDKYKRAFNTVCKIMSDELYYEEIGDHITVDDLKELYLKDE